MADATWPDCFNNLAPFRPRLSPPSEILKKFHELGWPPNDFLPIYLIALHGSCSTGAYQDCPTLPEWHTTNAAESGDNYWENAGGYHWCDFDLYDAKRKQTQLRMVFNSGNPDTNDGIWGMVWDRRNGKVIAELESHGDSLSLVTLVSKRHQTSFAPHPHPVPTTRDNNSFFMTPTKMKFKHSHPIEQLISVAIAWYSGLSQL